MSAIDKAARLAAQAAAAAAAQAAKTKSLNPPFPFKTVPLDARFLGLR